MRLGRRLVALGAAVAVTAGLAPTAVARPLAPGAAPGTHTVTLITGDRVTVGETAWRVEPGPGRDGMTFSVDRSGERLSVVPADALSLLRGDRLDRRLFDVTGLIDAGYDDANRDTLPLIVTYTGAVPRSVTAATITRELRSVNGSAVTADKATATTAWHGLRTSRTGVEKIWLDGVVKPLLDHSVPQIGAPAAWAAGYTGAGVKVAVLDSGVDQTHPDLVGREVAERNFTDSADAVDRYGHGTHIASTIAGNGATYRGVAPDAAILDGKVLNDMGWSSDSWTIAAMEWAAEQGAAVANMSLDGFDGRLLEAAVERLSAQYGILFVCAAGNAGAPGTITTPASADSALAVGAVDDQDAVAPFSSQGPSIHDGPIKPEITAPGVGIVAAKAAEGTIGTPAGDGYVSLNGSSMATPHVVGAAAVLAQRRPDWTGQQLKSALMASAAPTPGASAFAQGAGRVDVARAVTQVVTTTPTSVNLGTAAWPHTDDQPLTAPLTYHNAGGADVTLDLTVSGLAPDGAPAPDGMFSLDATRLTVPAGGDAAVTVVADTRAGATDGRFTAHVRATGDGTAVSTPVAVEREVESYDLTVDVRAPDGTPATDYTMRLLPASESIDYSDLTHPRYLYDPDGTVEARLPKGAYSVLTAVVDGTGHQHLLPYPALTLDRDTSFVAAASAARPVRVTPPDPAAAPDGASVGIDMTYTNVPRPVTAEFYGADVADFSLAPVGPALPADRMSTHIGTHLSVPGGDTYFLAWFVKGTVPAGFTKVVRRQDLAKVDVHLHAERPGRPAIRGAVASPVDGAATWSGSYLTEPPADHTEYYTTDGVRWQGTLETLDPDTGFTDRSLFSPLAVYQAGRTYRARFGGPVIGPAFNTPVDGVPDALRQGDLVNVWMHVFGDGAGNSGDSPLSSASTRLYRNGTLVGEGQGAGIGVWRVPAEADDYRLVVEAERDPAFDVSTRLAVAWTFRSGHADDVAALPLSAVRFSPVVSADNTAPAGTPFVVPVAVQAQDGSRYTPSRLTMDVSYDEGQTWRRAVVVHNSAVVLDHPATATSVSLRAKATDGAGNTVEQTVIRAYKLAP
ncbi:S8 family serine peptidase [Actinophytocola sp. NPDC049390]|uniref:S8 family serine peptidase n=1 Tax=Actinophytocola sp. NPDC049390 TaxID=3363894 RepID=UPI0037A3A379